MKSTKENNTPINNFRKAFDELSSGPISEKNKKESVPTPSVQPDPVSPSFSTEATPKTLSIISPDTKITGNISTSGDLEILGSVEGNISSEGQITISGSVAGDLEAVSLSIKSGSVKSEKIMVNDTFLADESSSIEGNIHCNTMTVNAKITGNIETTGSCTINSSAVIVGDIKANDIAINSGAKIKGLLDVASS